MKEEAETYELLEKEPTAYLLRRNFGTRMYQLGLTDPEIQYVIGHDIEMETVTRAAYRNEEKLYPIYLKMRRRFLLNDTAQEPIVIEDRLTRLQDRDEVLLHIPCRNEEQLRITIRSNDADSALRFKVTGRAVHGSLELNQWPDTARRRDEVNITTFARKAFHGALNTKRLNTAQAEEASEE